MMRAYRAASPEAQRTAYYGPTFRKAFEALAAHAHGLALVLDVEGVHGMLLASAEPSPFAPVLSARDWVWWIDPEARRGRRAWRMLEAYEAWLDGVGVQERGIAGMDGRAARLFAARGYTPVETTYRVH